MKIFKQNYVGVDHTRDDITDAPLAFLTPYEDNAAGKKRQESVMVWLRGYYGRSDDDGKTETRIEDNTPRDGFKVVDVASRWSTSNKFARIVDPNGYELEINIDNLIDLMLYCVVDHGEIKAKCIWAREGAHNRLIPVESDLYKFAVQEGQVLEQNIGDIVTAAHATRYIYLGKMYRQWVARTGTVPTETNATKSSHAFYNYRNLHHTFTPTGVSLFDDEKASHVYLACGLKKWRDPSNTVITRQKPMKISANEGPVNIDGIEDRLFDCDDSKYFYPTQNVWSGGRHIGGAMGDEYSEYVRKVRISYDKPNQTAPSLEWLKEQSANTSLVEDQS